MKGMVFNAFESFVETSFGADVADQAFSLSELTDGGAYTSVGFYPHDEFLVIAAKVAEATKHDLRPLIRDFGADLFHQLAKGHAEIMSRYNGPVQLLAEIESVIHVNVRKLYADTELPRFDVIERQGDSHIVLHYRSARPMADLAHGLIEGCTHFFGLAEHSSLERYDVSEDGKSAKFALRIEENDQGQIPRG